MNRTRIVVFAGLLVAMYVIFNYWLSIPLTPWLIINFGFLPLSFMSMLLGPLWGSVAAAAGDVVGTLLSNQGPFYFGFTVSAVVSAVIYALFLYRKPKTLLRIILAVVCVTVLVDFGMNTYWLSNLYGKGFFVMLPGRIIKSVAMLPVHVAAIYGVWCPAGAIIEKRYTV